MCAGLPSRRRAGLAEGPDVPILVSLLSPCPAPVTSACQLATDVVPAEDDAPIFVEPRWPIALVLVIYIAMTITLRVTVPDRPRLGPEWLVPTVEILFLAALVLADPAHISARARWLRRFALALTFALLAMTLASTVVLIRDLIEGGKATDSADVLLASGALVWLGNVVVFSLLYWQLDGGGPLARFRGRAAVPRLPLHAAGEPRVRAAAAGGRSSPTT